MTQNKFFSQVRLLMISLLAGAFACASAQSTADSLALPYPDYQEDVFMDMDFEPNLATPDVPASAKKSIIRSQRAFAQKFKDDFTVELMRDGEVVIVSVCTDDLVSPASLETLLEASVTSPLPLVPSLIPRTNALAGNQGLVFGQGLAT